MTSLVVVVAGIFVVSYILRWLLGYYRLFSVIEKINGPRAYPFIGNLLQFKADPDDWFEQASAVCNVYQTPYRMCRVWLLCQPYIVVYGADEAEPILSSNRNINKSSEYKFLQPWMGLGLLTSYAEKWRPRRKLLTPTFHYDILKDFMPVFNVQAKILLKKLEQKASKGRFDVYPYMTLCALDIICESAMGQHVNAQQNQNSDYVKAIYKLNEIIHQRQKSPWLWPNFLFDLTEPGKKHKWCLDIIHGFTNKVIKERYEVLKNGTKEDHEELTTVGGKKRLAFLDLLIDMAEKGHITYNDIGEEVNTFTFEGHDTTSAGMNWTLHLLGSHPEIQAKVHQELDNLFGDDNRDCSYEDLKSLNYLECVLKESLRLYPSVPMFARKLDEDAYIAGLRVPAGTQIMMNPHGVHRDPRHWPDPEIFDPERFQPENVAGRHPYAYVPFSAGARNCIGQRFALMEEKTVMSWILRHFKVKSMHRRDQVRPKGELILRPNIGVHVELELRRPITFESDPDVVS